ncbi:hypothetical protein [Rhodococcus ruber]|uniref:hypothetical protein n=1 Tax=Rhodococcus ruber TaxID=1830 RepID=UPI003782F614
MAGVKVHTPVAGFTGTVVGVRFTDGVGETDSATALSYFRRKGYRLEEPVADPQPAGTTDGEGDTDRGQDGGDLALVDAYDPAEHTVDQVNAYLAGADRRERERILQSEADGEARKGILHGPHSDLSGLN